jgi:hypothetical protein
MNQPEQNKIRVYIYTAVNGHDWQVGDAALAESLSKCLGTAMKTERQNGEIPLGGILRGTVGGYNGTMVYRLHVRETSDFTGRPSKYVAAAFLPFVQLGERVVDYAALWRHPLLAKPRPRGEPLENLSVDLDREGLLSRGAPPASDEPRSYWTDERDPVKDAQWTGEETILSSLGAVFQSRKTELGSFAARLFRKEDETVFVRSWYTPFAPVAEEVAARKKCERLRRERASEDDKLEALKDWESSVEALESLTDPHDGKFRHFLGLCEFAKAERRALSMNPEEEAILASAKTIFDLVDRLLGEIGKTLTGEQEGVLSALAGILDVQQARLDQIPHAAEGESPRCEELRSRIDALRTNQKSIDDWLKTLDADGLVLEEKMDGLSPRLENLAAALISERKSRENVQSSLRETNTILLERNKEINRLKETIRELEAEQAPPSAPAGTAGEGGEGEGARRGVWRFLLWFLGSLLLLGGMVWFILFRLPDLLPGPCPSPAMGSPVDRNAADPPLSETPPANRSDTGSDRKDETADGANGGDGLDRKGPAGESVAGASPETAESEKHP